ELEVHHDRRREAERNRVDERVELLAKAASRSGGARDTAVEDVGDAAEDDEGRRGRELAADGQDDGVDAAEQVEERQAVRHEHDRAAHDLAWPALAARASAHGDHWLVSSPSTVVPANVMSPTFTRSAAPAGRKTSTR